MEVFRIYGQHFGEFFVAFFRQANYVYARGCDNARLHVHVHGRVHSSKHKIENHHAGKITISNGFHDFIQLQIGFYASYG